jgi:predicted O-linked N-acetylglucosamine transferase (SPINDLY family)
MIDIERKNYIVKNYKIILNDVNGLLAKSVESDNINTIQNYREQAINLLSQITEIFDVRDYLLIDSNPEIPKNIYIDSNFTLGTLYKTYVETKIKNDTELLKKNSLNRSEKNITLSDENIKLFRKGIEHFNNILRVNFEDIMALKQIVSIYTQLCFFAQDNILNCLQYMQEALLYCPNNETIHYNLGYIYQKLNKLELSIIHYKISIALAETNISTDKEIIDELRCLKLNSLNGISCIFRSIKQWPEALYYLQRAEKIDSNDPDIQNQLGVVYTEMRRTDLAEIAYNKGIQNYKKSFISTDKNFFLAELYLNLGHMHAYNGDNNKSVENYNRSLQICPKFALPFQNKLMNLSYLFDQLQEKIYITDQHKLVNKLYKKGNGMYKFDKEYFNNGNDNEKINIGIISGDFVDHPVSFFISTFLKKFNTDKFNVTCYSECIIDTKRFNEKLQFKTIKNYSAEQASNMIYTDKIHILFDLAGHTAFNRLDIFAMKPSPIQITYIGYPFSTGLDEMDYRITDKICDGDFSVSQKFYTEELLELKNCFLCYDPNVNKLHELSSLPMMKNNWITIGCFNRLNKITDSVISLFNSIMLKFKNVKFMFKTKALINKNIQKTFISKFDKQVRSRIIILDCTISHDSHLLTYNQVDFAIDTYPYSGTTTTCEALYMGVPVFSLYDSEYFFHAQNVTCSILKNSDLDYYIFKDKDELMNKLDELYKTDKNKLINLKNDTRNKFLNGKVCNQIEYMKNLETLLADLFLKHKIN